MHSLIKDICDLKLPLRILLSCPRPISRLHLYISPLLYSIFYLFEFFTHVAILWSKHLKHVNIFQEKLKICYERCYEAQGTMTDVCFFYVQMKSKQLTTFVMVFLHKAKSLFWNWCFEFFDESWSKFLCLCQKLWLIFIFRCKASSLALKTLLQAITNLWDQTYQGLLIIF